MARRPTHQPSQSRGRPVREGVWALHVAGVRHSDIARRLSVSPGRVTQILDAIYAEEAEQRADDRERLRRLENLRLDRLQARLWLAAAGPDDDAAAAVDTDGDERPGQTIDSMLSAVSVALKIMERRAKLNGLDAPTKIAPVTSDGRASWAGALPNLKEMSYDELTAYYASLGGGDHAAKTGD